MENLRKWVVLTYAAFAALIAYVFFALLIRASASFDLEARVRHADVFIQGGAVALGLILFAWLYRHAQVNQFMEEVFEELSKVTWPTQQETSKSTVVVIIMVLISGVILGGFDTLWTWLLKFIL